MQLHGLRAELDRFFAALLLHLLTPTIMSLPGFEALETRFIARTTLVAIVLRVLPNQLR